MANGTDYSATLFGDEQKPPVSQGTDYSTAIFGAPEEPMSWGGLGENILKGGAALVEGAKALPGAIWNLPSNIGKGIVAGYEMTGDPTLDPEALKRGAALSKSIEQGTGQMLTSAKDALIWAKEHPGQVPGKVVRLAYDYPVDVALLATGPLTKLATKTALGLRALEAAKIAGGSTGLLPKVLGASAKTAEVTSKVLPWLNPMKLPEEGLKGTARLVGNKYVQARNVVHPVQAEINRVIGPNKQPLIDILEGKPISEPPYPPYSSTSKTMPGSVVDATVEPIIEPVIKAETVPLTGVVPVQGPRLPGSQMVKEVQVGETGLQKPAQGGVGPVTTEPVKQVGGASTVEATGKTAGYGYEDVFAPYRTAGERASKLGSTEGDIYAAIEQKVSKYPQANRAFSDLEIGRADLRNNIVRETAASTPQLEKAAQQVVSAGDIPYEAAKTVNREIDLNPVNKLISKMMKDHVGNRDLMRELKGIRANLYDEITGKLRTSPRSVASVIDDLKGVMGKGDNKHLKTLLGNVKDSMFTQFPEYKQADVLYRELWAPVNRQQIGGYLSDILETKGAKAYTKAFEDMPGTIKNAMNKKGKPYFKDYAPIFEDSEDALTKLRSVNDDIKSELGYKRSSSNPRAVAAAEKLFEPENINLPSLINRPYDIVKWVLKNTQGNWTLKQAEEFAKSMHQAKTLGKEAAIPIRETAAVPIKKAFEQEKRTLKRGKNWESAIKKVTSVPAGALYLGQDKLNDMLFRYGMPPAGYSEPADSSNYYPIRKKGEM
jgi:hypothetical protein